MNAITVHPEDGRADARSLSAALASALGYFDSYRRGRGTANLIQAQRDFFGAHGFDRIDGVDKHHGPWGSGLNDFS